MNILTKQYGFTEKKEPKYLIYLQENNEQNLKAFDVVGDLNRVICENELMEDYSITNIRFVDYNTYKIENGILTESYPLILCFYIDRDLISNPEIFKPFYDAVNIAIKMKDANILAFFMPCEIESERVECINPIQISDPEMGEINKLVEDLTKQFNVGA